MPEKNNIEDNKPPISEVINNKIANISKSPDKIGAFKEFLSIKQTPLILENNFNDFCIKNRYSAETMDPTILPAYYAYVINKGLFPEIKDAQVNKLETIKVLQNVFLQHEFNPSNLTLKQNRIISEFLTPFATCLMYFAWTEEEKIKRSLKDIIILSQEELQFVGTTLPIFMASEYGANTQDINEFYLNKISSQNPPFSNENNNFYLQLSEFFNEGNKNKDLLEIVREQYEVKKQRIIEDNIKRREGNLPKDINESIIRRVVFLDQNQRFFDKLKKTYVVTDIFSEENIELPKEKSKKIEIKQPEINEVKINENQIENKEEKKPRTSKTKSEFNRLKRVKEKIPYEDIHSLIEAEEEVPYDPNKMSEKEWRNELPGVSLFSLKIPRRLFDKTELPKLKDNEYLTIVPSDNGNPCNIVLHKNERDIDFFKDQEVIAQITPSTGDVKYLSPDFEFPEGFPRMLQLGCIGALRREFVYAGDEVKKEVKERVDLYHVRVTGYQERYIREIKFGGESYKAFFRAEEYATPKSPLIITLVNNKNKIRGKLLWNGAFIVDNYSTLKIQQPDPKFTPAERSRYYGNIAEIYTNLQGSILANYNKYFDEKISEAHELNIFSLSKSILKTFTDKQRAEVYPVSVAPTDEDFEGPGYTEDRLTVNFFQSFPDQKFISLFLKNSCGTMTLPEKHFASKDRITLNRIYNLKLLNPPKSVTQREDRSPQTTIRVAQRHKTIGFVTFIEPSINAPEIEIYSWCCEVIQTMEDILKVYKTINEKIDYVTKLKNITNAYMKSCKEAIREDTDIYPIIEKITDDTKSEVLSRNDLTKLIEFVFGSKEKRDTFVKKGHKIGELQEYISNVAV